MNIMSVLSIFLLSIARIYAAAAPTEEELRNSPTVGDYVTKLYKFGIPAGMALAGLVMIYAGYIFITSQGNPDGIKQAKDLMIGALTGLALIILAGVILKNVIGVSY